MDAIDESIEKSDQVQRLLGVVESDGMTSKEIMEKLELSYKPTFRKNYLDPALKNGFVEMSRPESPNSPKQKYRKV